MSGRIVYKANGARFADVQVVENGRTRSLRFGPSGGWQGAVRLDDPNRAVFPYQRAFQTVSALVPAPSRFLQVGVGTGTGLRSVMNAHPDCELYGVEIEQTVVDVAVQFFQCPDHHRVNYWIGDGVAFLCNVDLQFDFIFVDAYNAHQIYAPCLDPAFATVLDAALTDSGIAVSNVIARHPLTGQAAAFVDSAKRVFPHVFVLPVGNPLVDQNMLIILSKTPVSTSSWQAGIRKSPFLKWHERFIWPHRLEQMV